MANRKWHELVCYVYRDGVYYETPNPLHDKLNEPLCNRLDQLRHQNGWSMKEFAIRMGVSPYTFSGLVHGRIFPYRMHLLYLSTMFGTDVDEWEKRCVDGYRSGSGMIVHPSYYITYKQGHLTLVERHKP